MRWLRRAQASSLETTIREEGFALLVGTRVFVKYLFDEPFLPLNLPQPFAW